MSELRLGGARHLPVVLGAEAAECGLACLTMIARYWGHDVDLNGMRQRFTISMAGATLRSIIQQANLLSLSTRALRVELSAIGKIKLPAILHWDLNHFVVLKSVGRSHVVIHDPAFGSKRLSLSEFSDHFTGVVLETTPAKEFTKIVAVAPTKISDLWSEISGFWPAIIHVLALSVALQVVVFASPFQMQLVVDEAINRNDNDLLIVLAIAFGALVVVQALVESLRSWTVAALGQMLSFQLIGNLIRHLMRLPVDWFEKRHIGDILSRIHSTKPIQDAITVGAISAVLDGVMGLIAGIVIFLYSPILASAVFASVALNLMLSLALYPATKARMEEQIVASAKEQSFTMESIRAAVTIKLMARESEREAGWRNLFVNTMNAGFSLAKYAIYLSALQTVIFGLQTVTVIYLGAKLVLDGAGFSVGMLFAFMSFRSTFTDRMNGLVAQIIEFRLLGLHLRRIGDIVHAERDAVQGNQLVSKMSGVIEFVDVCFRYGSADRLILEKVNFTIRPGDYIAITGPSGGGKSTLCKLLLGLYPPTSGQILLDGNPATPELWRSWRERVGLVSQADQLLSGSIADNIAFFDPDLDMEKVQAAARQASVHEDILRMPMQYLSLVGDMGSTLSGGQRQRVLFARALYRAPSILVLDEGTANLDLETELKIADLVKDMNITRIIIAHRPALIQNADKYLILDGSGEVRISADKSVDSR